MFVNSNNRIQKSKKKKAGKSKKTNELKLTDNFEVEKLQKELDDLAEELEQEF